jgi:cation:H+ antiporter
MPSALLIVAGLAGLLFGADLLVRGGAALAGHLGVRPIVIGLTVVSLGTSLPELAVPIAFERRTLRFDLRAMTAASLALWLLALDGGLSALDGTILCVGGVGYTAGIVWTSRRESEPVRADYAAHVEPATGGRGLLVRGLMLLAGLALVLLGAELLVDGSSDIARSLEVSEAIIGLTVIAIGTSAPELVTTLTSTLRGDRDIAVGNLLGSTVYNIAPILGIAVLAAPAEVQIPHEVIAADLLLLAVVAVTTVPVLLSGHRVSRLEGGAFVAAYVGCLIWLIVV